MKILNKSYFRLGILIVTSTFSITTFAQSKNDQITHFLQESMKIEKIPGLAYAVLKDGKLDTKGCLGIADLSWSQQVTSQTSFQIASVSKVFCGILLARMFDTGLLTPDIKLSSLIDSIPETWKNITVLQLANHQSGIKIGNFSKTQNTKEALEVAKKQEMQFQPGHSDAYVSSDYWILQYIIEKKTGKTYFQALNDYVLKPLGMRNTFVNNWKDGYVQLSEIVPTEAKVYHWLTNPDRFVVGNFPFVSTGYAAGGIYTSIDDFVRLMLCLNDPGFLSEKSRQLLTNTEKLEQKQGTFGLGFMVYPYQGTKLVGHSGGPALADVCYFPEKGITVIVLTNQRGFYPYLARCIASFYIPDLIAEGPPEGHKF